MEHTRLVGTRETAHMEARLLWLGRIEFQSLTCETDTRLAIASRKVVLIISRTMGIKKCCLLGYAMSRSMLMTLNHSNKQQKSHECT
jgi:hypothetical protein